VLAILAELIDKYVFLPTYLLPEESEFKELLYKLSSEEPDKERFLRGMMLSILEDKQEDSEERLVNEAIKELMRRSGVEEIIPRGSNAEFEQRIRDILNDAKDAWRSAQVSTDIFMCEFEYTRTAGFEWTPFKFLAGNIPEREDISSPTSTHDPDDDFVALIPRIYIVLPGKEPEPITHGTVIRKSHLRAMLLEERESSQSMEQAPRRSRNRQSRTLSMSAESARNGHTREGFLSQAVAPSKGSSG
jgi:hypothetical protein